MTTRPPSISFARALQSQGYAVVSATDGEAGLEAVHEHRPDLVLLDVNMPSTRRARDVPSVLKADPALPFTPVILVTALVDARDMVAGLDAGADEYITKPVESAALMARVRSMLRMKALHDRVQDQAAERLGYGSSAFLAGRGRS